MTMEHYVTRGITPNRDLEDIRNKVLRESEIHDNYQWIEELIHRTARIHAGFLYDDRKTLQDLCLFIGETQNKLTDSGWEAFGHHLGLSRSVLKVINHNNFNKEDPTYNVLLAFVQFEDATIGKIIDALWKIGRLDVISRIRKQIFELADVVFRVKGDSSSDNNTSATSGYESLQVSNEGASFNSRSDSDIIENIGNNNDNFNNGFYQKDIIKPLIIPPAPFIFQNIKCTPLLVSHNINQALQTRDLSLYELQNNNNNTNNVRYVKEFCVQNQISKGSSSSVCRSETKKDSTSDVQKLSKPKKYGKIIMLTFAPDGEKYAEQISKILRRERDCFPRIGVLILHEHVNEVMKDPQHFITSSFHQVDYVCPILTDLYIKFIRRRETPMNLSNLQLDARYVQFIYTLMNNYYICNGCLNDKIRCIIPDEQLTNIHFDLIMSIPIFSAWVKLSEVEEMTVRLLKSK